MFKVFKELFGWIVDIIAIGRSTTELIDIKVKSEKRIAKKIMPIQEDVALQEVLLDLAKARQKIKLAKKAFEEEEEAYTASDSSAVVIDMPESI